ncbi:MAG: hypothetical protein ACLQDY_18800 [Streptosporangiaceae bacterium]
MAESARPTLRCLREDLGLPVPRADKPLDEVAHPLLEKATERFADDQTPHERIESDEVWPGATDGHPMHGQHRVEVDEVGTPSSSSQVIFAWVSPRK